VTFLDMRTIIFCSVVADVVCLVVILSLWHQSRKRFSGMGFWAFDFTFQTAAMFLIILRGSIPDWMSMVLANTLIIGGAILGYMGLGSFVGKKISQVHNYLLLAAFVCIHAYFTLFQPSQAARNLNVTIGLLIICFQCLWFLVHGVESGMRRLTLGVGVVFGGYCLVSIIRIVAFFTGTPAANNFFHSGAFESLMLISYQMLFILLTYSLVLMVNKRLLMEVTTQEEKFAKAFRSSPYGITLTRLSDGEIIEVNDGFLSISGYQYAEVIGTTTIDLHLWNKEEDRAVAVNELSKSGKVQGREFQFRKKSGEWITGLFSAEIILINNQKYVLSSISDITERKQAEMQLEEVAKKYSALFNANSDGVWIHNLNGEIVEVNDAYCQMSGFSRGELTHMPISRIVAVKTPEEIADHIKRVTETDGHDRFESRHRRKDGSIFNVDVTVPFSRKGSRQYSGIRARHHGAQAGGGGAARE
jgi:PAS domain S-box-containing protein